jgi:hypothetical protein|tara:strand:- start:287 stop:637 length:351 start_codon:yes stop_codon:yes gene_type:complete
MAPQISLNTLYEMKNKKDKIKNATFDEIIHKCHAKIKKTASSGGQFIFFEIPYVLIGKPLYKIGDSVEYIYNALKKNGLFVNVLEPPNINILYISWAPTDINKRKLLKNDNYINNL